MLELIDVKKVYKTKAGDTVALNGVSLKFADKGLVFITGKSGCGKTTLLNIIGGLDNLDSGDIIIDGKKFSEFTISDYDNYRNTLVGFVFQEYNLLPEFSIKKNIDIANELQGRKSQINQVENILSTVDIGGYENRKPAQLSGGQKQRVAIARALIKNPKIVLADEPTGALDSATGIQVMDILKELSKDKLIIVVSHEMEFAERYADRIIRIVDGQVIEDITLSDVEIKDSVYDLGEELVVKTGIKLNKEEGEKVLTAIENNKKISITDKISVREKIKTKNIESEKLEKPVSFIKSKMKFNSVFALGVKSLFSKPVRLVFTILLSVIAFSVFGIFDAVASYNTQKAIEKVLEGNEYNAVSISAMMDDEDYQQAKFKFSQEYIDSINSKTGYSFRGVYDLNDKEEFRGNARENVNKSFVIDEFASITTENEKYYKKDFNGIIEFKESEIKQGVILKGAYNYKILPYNNSHYPASINTERQEVGISYYMAESIMCWLRHGNKKVFGEKIIDLNNLGSLIGANLKIDSKKYVISAIIDCGDIPAKYDLLKTEQANEHPNLKNDFETYLNSSCNLMLFLPDGYVRSVREKNGRVVSYVAEYSNSTKFKVKTISDNAAFDKTHDKTNSIFYNINDFTAQNTILFDDVDNLDNSKPVLKNDEVLINAFNIKSFFYPEEQRSVDFGLQKKFKDAIEMIFIEQDLDGKKQAVKDFIQVIKQLYPTYNNDLILDKILNKSVEINRYSGQNTTPSLTKTYKIKGFYFGVDTDTYTSLTNQYTAMAYPLAMTEEGLKNIDVNPNQGIYSRAISSLYGADGNGNLLSVMLTQESGFKLSWYNNKIIEILELPDNVETISGFVNLFLYAAIILMAFSAFMLMNYITTSIASKRQTIGILRALGTNGASVFTMFLIESVIIALINGALACVVGYVASMFVNAFIIESMYLTINFAMFGIRQIILILLANLITGFVSSIIPIIKIVKEKPVALIRKE